MVKMQNFKNFFKINSIKQLTTVINCYIVFMSTRVRNYKTVISFKKEMNIMIYVCPKCEKEYEESVKKCPVCEKRLKRQYTQEELEKIKKENDDALVINTFFM